MRAPGIRARFPLGVYIGHRPDGSPDPLPSTLRLHAALVASACTGSTAVFDGGRLVRSASATRALEWLEDNPPDYVELPPCLENSPTDITFRDQGVMDGVGKDPDRKKAPRTFGSGTAVSAPIGWGWKELPDEVATALGDLCADVPCLGETDSAAILEVGEIAPTHRRVERPSSFNRVATRIASPIPGRLTELDEQHETARPTRRPTAAGDRWTKTESPASALPTHHRSVDIGYDLIEAAPPRPAPWDRAVHIAIDTQIGGLERVDWSVALHRAMVKALDTEAASIVTGKYVRGVTPPANRVAIQPVDESIMDLSTYDLGPGLLVLVPAGDGAQGLDDPMETVRRALSGVTRLYRRSGVTIRLGRQTVVDARTFWKEPARSTVREWVSVPAVVPETRRPRRGARQWTLADSARLSLGFVFRDHFEVPDGVPAEARYASLADQVAAQGVEILETSIIPDADVHRYAHKLPDGVVAQPYRLRLRGGGLVPEQAVIAVGQSRHLGGGLLVPVDVPAAVAEAWGDVR